MYNNRKKILKYSITDVIIISFQPQLKNQTTADLKQT